MIGNRGNRGPRPWNQTAWNADEWRRLRLAHELAPAAADTPAFWLDVAARMGTRRSPAAVERRASERGLRAKIENV